MPATVNSSAKNIYIISGLGADWRVFQFLRLPPNYQVVHLPWLEPLHIDEPLQAYVKRLGAAVQEPNPILVGLSFGGVAAIELGKILNPEKLILISSLSTQHGIPWHYRLMGKMKLQRVVPMPLLRATYPAAPYFFGAHTPYQKELLKDVYQNMSELYLRWSLDQLLKWKQHEVMPQITHLHGTSDKVLPFRNGSEIIKIKGGEHLMVMNRAEEISTILKRILNEI
ncbi:alpha/beta hydrolase [Pontibacter harenae]|uniref:alpha/beta hydrolase n=1 Tax=Pontibacter harenae TaxID=2894083 RepID=UPI001E2B9773|nr:alpha/beta hydrolase [Pontibacter harenae]MCC9167650.1 alpha/beta hydrolase [Pontibacter harenae]